MGRRKRSGWRERRKLLPELGDKLRATVGAERPVCQPTTARTASLMRESEGPMNSSRRSL